VWSRASYSEKAGRHREEIQSGPSSGRAVDSAGVGRMAAPAFHGYCADQNSRPETGLDLAGSPTPAMEGCSGPNRNRRNYEDGEPFFSPRSCSQLLSHSSGAAVLRWQHVHVRNRAGNLPRYPFVVGGRRWPELRIVAAAKRPHGGLPMHSPAKNQPFAFETSSRAGTGGAAK